jgi:protein arginine kinase activator
MVDGTEKELYVCQKCAEAGNKADEAPPDLADGDSPKGIPVAAKLITGLLKQMIDAGLEAASIVENPMSRPSGPPCPVCGMTPDDYRRITRLGCAHCYEHFSQILAPVIRDMQPGASHVGKVPETPQEDARRSK